MSLSDLFSCDERRRTTLFGVWNRMEWKYGIKVTTTLLCCQSFEQDGRYVHVCHCLVHVRTIVMHFQSVLQDGTVTLQCEWMIQTQVLELTCRILVGLGLLEMHFFCKLTVETIVMDLWMVLRPLSVMVSWYCIVKTISVLFLWGCYHLKGLHLPVMWPRGIGANSRIQTAEPSPRLALNHSSSSTSFVTSPSDDEIVIETRRVTQNWKYVIRTKKVWVDCRMVYQRADLYEWRCMIQIRTVIVHCQCVIQTRNVSVHRGYVVQTRNVVIRRRRVVRLRTLVMQQRYQICAWTGIRPRIGILPAMGILVDWGTITQTHRVSQRFRCLTRERTYTMHRRCSLRTQLIIIQWRLLIRTRIILSLERCVILRHTLTRNSCRTFQCWIVYTFCSCLIPHYYMHITSRCVNALIHCTPFRLRWSHGYQFFTALFDSRIYVQESSVFMFFRCLGQIRNFVIAYHFQIYRGRVNMWICRWWENVTLVVDWRCVISQTGVLTRWVCFMESMSVVTVQQV